MKVYNTLTKQKETLKPINNKKINLFVCGPTVYDNSHLGHAKTYTQFDFIARYLKHLGYDVYYLQNITDIDNKILDRAKKLKVSWKKLARKYEKHYLEDMKELRNVTVTKYARATDYIEQIVKQIKTLINGGYAYTIKDGIYFEISKFREYGKLSGRTKLKKDDSMTRIDENGEKKGWNDFCLWKFSKPAESFWKTEIGTGRPGWHIEDTAITEKHFGPQYDIHGGAVSGKKPLVKYWMHTGFLNINTEKMSKSKGNFLTIRDALKKYNYRTLRFLFLSSHYRSSLGISEKVMNQAHESLHRIDEFVFNIIDIKFDDKSNIEGLKKLRKAVYKELNDDFNTPNAIAKIFEFIRKQNVKGKSEKRVYSFFKEINTHFDFINFEVYSDIEIDKLVEKRNLFRSTNKFKEADKIREQLEKKGIKIYDKQLTTSWRRIK